MFIFKYQMFYTNFKRITLPLFRFLYFNSLSIISEACFCGIISSLSSEVSTLKISKNDVTYIKIKSGKQILLFIVVLILSKLQVYLSIRLFATIFVRRKSILNAASNVCPSYRMKRSIFIVKEYRNCI